jgi:hypothetical protein
MPTQEVVVYVIDPPQDFIGPHDYEGYLRHCVNFYMRMRRTSNPNNITVTVHKTPHNISDNEFTLILSSPTASEIAINDFKMHLCSTLASGEMIERVSFQPGGRRRRTRHRRHRKSRCKGRSLARHKK